MKDQAENDRKLFHATSYGHREKRTPHAKKDALSRLVGEEFADQLKAVAGVDNPGHKHWVNKKENNHHHATTEKDQKHIDRRTNEMLNKVRAQTQKKNEETKELLKDTLEKGREILVKEMHGKQVQKHEKRHEKMHNLIKDLPWKRKAQARALLAGFNTKNELLKGMHTEARKELTNGMKLDHLKAHGHHSQDFYNEHFSLLEKPTTGGDIVDKIVRGTMNSLDKQLNQALKAGKDTTHTKEKYKVALTAEERYKEKVEQANELMQKAIRTNPTRMIGSTQKGWTSLDDPAVLAAIKNKQVWIDRSDKVNPDDPQVAAELAVETIKNAVDNQNNLIQGDLVDVAKNIRRQMENLHHKQPEVDLDMANDAKPVSSKQDKQKIKMCFATKDPILTNTECNDFMSKHCMTHTTKAGICTQWRNSLETAANMGEVEAHERMAKFVNNAIKSW